MKEVELRDIDVSNVNEILELKVQDEQKSFVADIKKSLSYAYGYRNIGQAFGIYAGNTIVGYILIIFDREDGMYNIWHFFIDVKHQGKGYGKQALMKSIHWIREGRLGKSNTISLCVEEDNILARRIYERTGFYETGERDEDNEIVMYYDL